MPKFRFQLDVRDPPVKVIGAMVDFSGKRNLDVSPAESDALTSPPAGDR